MEDKEEYELSIRGVCQPTTVRLPGAVSRRVSLMHRPVSWSDEEGIAGVIMVVSTRVVVLSEGQ